MRKWICLCLALLLLVGCQSSQNTVEEETTNNTASMDSFDDEKRDILCSLVQEKGINRQQISRYAPLFPDKAMRNLIESEIIYYVAQ